MSPSGRVHIIGAGLAGLSAAVRLTEAGVAVTLYEAAAHAGGRCRSYDDGQLGRRIDNGNHLLLAANRAALQFLETIGAGDSLIGPSSPEFSFVDLVSGERWVLRPNRGRVPWWLLSRRRRIPGTGPLDYLGAVRFLGAPAEACVFDLLGQRSIVARRLWHPLAIAALNTDLGDASARLFGRILRDSFGAGGDACRPLVPREGLSESFIDPALRWLRDRGTEVRFGARLRALSIAGDRIDELTFDGVGVGVAAGDQVILAVTAPMAGRLVPDLVVPDRFCAIVNAHYRVDVPGDAPGFVGVIGGTAEWVFRKPGILSVTVSAADRLVDTPAEDLASLLWRDVAATYRLSPDPLPAWQIVKERRATFAATPTQLARRPMPVTRWTNLTLAGDWTDTGLPATIEGAIRSGVSAAALVGGGSKIR